MRTENRADERPVCSSLPTYKMNKLVVLYRPLLPDSRHLIQCSTLPVPQETVGNYRPNSVTTPDGSPLLSLGRESRWFRGLWSVELDSLGPGHINDLLFQFG